MTFANSHLAYFFVCLFFASLLFVVTFLRKKKIISQIFIHSNYQSIKSKKRFLLECFLICLSLFFIILAILRPQWGFELRKIHQQGSDIFILADVSDSMWAEDLKPNRLEVMKRELKDFAKMIRGDRLGLIAFAGLAYVACPLTSDQDAFLQFVDFLDPQNNPIQGTGIKQALELALEALVSSPAESKALVLMTDGKVTVGSMADLIEMAQKNQIKIYVMGLGTKEGAPIPDHKEGGFKKDLSEQIVISKLNDDGLKNLATSSGGLYIEQSFTDSDWQSLYQKGIKGMLKEQNLGESEKRVPIERFHIFLLLALLFFLVAQCLRRI